MSVKIAVKSTKAKANKPIKALYNKVFKGFFVRIENTTSKTK